MKDIFSHEAIELFKDVLRARYHPIEPAIDGPYYAMNEKKQLARPNICLIRGAYESTQDNPGFDVLCLMWRTRTGTLTFNNFATSGESGVNLNVEGIVEEENESGNTINIKVSNRGEIPRESFMRLQESREYKIPISELSGYEGNK